MQEPLATRILAKVMSWNEDEVRRELGPLLVLAAAKYDRYQQYSPGMRFLESLAIWLQQFPTLPQRNLAFALVRERLVFISSDEMFHLIETSFPDYIRPLLMNVVAERLGLPAHAVTRIFESVEFKTLMAKTLYVGLSDGSQVGLLRRLNPPYIGHEHTFISYQRPEHDKVQEMLEKHLPAAVQNLTGATAGANPRYEALVLVDDFTASGISFFRTENGEAKGKLSKILRQVVDDRFAGLLDEGSVEVIVLFYVATPSSLSRIKADAEAFLIANNGQGIRLHVLAVQELDDETRVIPEQGDDLDALLKVPIQSSLATIVDSHWEKGNHERPHLGYNECALPVVIFHNTPNNSLPILWHVNEAYTALFPRTTRHGKQ